MVSTIEAIYENGVLRPVRPLTGLQNGQQVTLHLDAPAWPTAPIALEAEEAAFRDHMEKIGLLVRWSKPDRPPDANFTPIVVNGPPLSETIIEDRR